MPDEINLNNLGAVGLMQLEYQMIKHLQTQHMQEHL